METSLVKHKGASEDTLNEMHSLTATYCSLRLKQALSSGEPLPPSELSSIIRFLKDNGIECTPTDFGDKFSNIININIPELDTIEDDFE